jgi:hypothetical protein
MASFFDAAEIHPERNEAIFAIEQGRERRCGLWSANVSELLETSTLLFPGRACLIRICSGYIDQRQWRNC